MKTYEIAKLFSDIFFDNNVVAGAACLVEQSTDEITRPALIFEVAVNPMNETGSALRFTLVINVEGSADKPHTLSPNPALIHAQRVELVRDVLHGSQKTALLALLNAGTDFDFRGWSAVDCDPSTQSNHFRTPISAEGTVLVL